LVPMRRENWSFFEQQKKVFNDVFKDMGAERLGADWGDFDRQLEKMRKDMFQLKAFDFNDFGSSMIKPENPIVSDAEGNKRLSLRFDCKDYKPEDIHVKTINNQLTVQAKHVEESPGRKVSREFSRQYTLPHKIDPLTLNSTLAADGVLTIEAPAPNAIEAPREIILPIKQLSN